MLEVLPPFRTLVRLALGDELAMADSYSHGPPDPDFWLWGNADPVAVGVILVVDRKICLLKYGDKWPEFRGVWRLPALAGRWSAGEARRIAAREALRVDTGVEIGTDRLLFTREASVPFPKSSQYFTYYVVTWKAESDGVAPQLVLPSEATEICLFGIDELPDALFLPERELLHSLFATAV